MKKYDPTLNKFLILDPNSDLIRSDTTDIVICKLDKYFGRFNHISIVTSIVRTPEKQLEIIINYAKKKNLPVLSDWAVNKKNPDGLYCWQKTWSKLLNLGIIINPPLAAVCLEDYWKMGVNKKGTIIQPSPHFFGKAFDIGGGSDGINDEVEIISTAMGEDKNLGIKNIIVERNNNCVHCDCF